MKKTKKTPKLLKAYDIISHKSYTFKKTDIIDIRDGKIPNSHNIYLKYSIRRGEIGFGANCISVTRNTIDRLELDPDWGKIRIIIC